MGSGFIAVGDGITLDTIIEGGTGSMSMILSQPKDLPDRLESGTLNNVAICGLAAGIDFVNSKKIDNIYNHEKSLMNMVYKEMSKMKMLLFILPILKMLFQHRYCLLILRIIRQKKLHRF